MAIQRILRLMDIAGINAKTLSQEIGLSHGVVTDWKKGKAKPSADALVKIAEYFEVPIEYLLGMGVFSNWDELWTEDGRSAMIGAVFSDYPQSMLSTGESVTSLFFRAINNWETDAVRLFDWAVKSVRLEVSNKYSDYSGRTEKVTLAYIDYSEILKMLISDKIIEAGMTRLTASEATNDFMKRMSTDPFSNLDEDEKRLLTEYRLLSTSQKGEVFKLVSGFRNKPFT